MTDEEREAVRRDTSLAGQLQLPVMDEKERVEREAREQRIGFEE